MTHHIAFYGKGGVGKTTLVTNIAASLVEACFEVMVVGCDPKGESTTLLNNSVKIPSVLDQIRNHTDITLDSLVHPGFKGISCVELGDPSSTVMCTSAELSRAIKELKRLDVFEKIAPDFVFYDISGENSFAALHAVIRQISISRLCVVTNADFKALQAANDVFSFLEQCMASDSSNRTPSD